MLAKFVVRLPRKVKGPALSGTVILYSHTHSQSEYHSAKSRISLRSNNTRRKANITEKAIAFCNCFFFMRKSSKTVRKVEKEKRLGAQS